RRRIDQVDDGRDGAHGLAAGGRMREACARNPDRRSGEQHESARELPAPALLAQRAGGLRLDDANLFVQSADAGLRISHCDLLRAHSMTTRRYCRDLSETLCVSTRTVRRGRASPASSHGVGSAHLEVTRKAIRSVVPCPDASVAPTTIRYSPACESCERSTWSSIRTRPAARSPVCSDDACAASWTVVPRLLPRSSVSVRPPGAAAETASRDRLSTVTKAVTVAT